MSKRARPELQQKYRVHCFDVHLVSDKSKVEQFLTSLEGEIITIFPKVSFTSFNWTSQIDFLIIVERVG